MYELWNVRLGKSFNELGNLYFVRWNFVSFGIRKIVRLSIIWVWESLTYYLINVGTPCKTCFLPNADSCRPFLSFLVLQHVLQTFEKAAEEGIQFSWKAAQKRMRSYACFWQSALSKPFQPEELKKVAWKKTLIILTYPKPCNWPNDMGKL